MCCSSSISKTDSLSVLPSSITKNLFFSSNAVPEEKIIQAVANKRAEIIKRNHEKVGGIEKSKTRRLRALWFLNTNPSGR